MAKDTKRQISRVKSSVLSRGLSLARLGVGAGTRLAGRNLAKIFEDETTRTENWKSFLVKQARVFSEEIGELKGSLMKAGQALSMYGEHFFPPEVNEFLKTLQHESPPVKWPAMREILLREWGPGRMDLLEIEETPIASASLGQVHRARLKSDGSTWALKIQYPGVDQAIDSDLRALRALLGMIQVFPKDFDTGPLFGEIRRMLVQETDYQIEADWTERYGTLLDGDDRYVVPRVNREFSTKKILMTSFENGVRPDDALVTALPLERRNRLAANFLDLYFRELFEWRLVQTDPHAGNYRVRLRPDGKDQLVLLDFGATREYPPSFMRPYRRMIQASSSGDREGFRQAARDLRFLDEGDDPKLKEMFEDFCFMLVEPFAEGLYDWKGTDLPQRTARKAMEILRGFAWRTPPEEIIFLDRKTGGVFIMLSLLGARFNGREILLRHLQAAAARGD